MTCERCNEEDARAVVLIESIPATLCRPCSRTWALRFVAHAAAVKLRATRLQIARYTSGRARRLPSPLELARDESWALRELQQLAVDFLRGLPPAQQDNADAEQVKTAVEFLSDMARAQAQQDEKPLIEAEPENEPETARLPL